jgi:hypothetical protein
MKTLTIHFRDYQQKAISADVPDDYEIRFSADGNWILTPHGVLYANDVLSAFVQVKSRVRAA